MLFDDGSKHSFATGVGSILFCDMGNRTSTGHQMFAGALGSAVEYFKTILFLLGFKRTAVIPDGLTQYKGIVNIAANLSVADGCPQCPNRST
jgi:hypothetical protein